MSTHVISFPRVAPREVTTLKNLEKNMFGNESNKVRVLSNGRVVVQLTELGFMELIHHVAVYAPEPTFFNRNRLVRVLHNEYETQDQATRAFNSN